MAYNLASLRTYVRDLTGVYSTDLVPNTLLTSWINEVYLDVARQQEWPWLPVTPLVADGDAPAFADEFRPLLSYRVAAKVLATQADDTNRGQVYLAEYKAMLDGMYQDNLQALATHTLTSLSGVSRYVRDLLSIYDDTLTDAVISSSVVDTYTDIYKSRTWAFAESPINYSLDGMGRALAFGAAYRLSGRYGKPAELVQSLQVEYTTAVDLLEQTQLTDNAGVALLTRANLSAFVRTLLNEYSKKIPTSLINTWISEEYALLCNAQNWSWLELDHQVTVPAGTNSFLLPNSVRKVLEMFVVKLVNSTDGITASVQESEIVYPVPSVLDGVAGDAHYRYDVSASGSVTLTPTPTSDITLRVRYTASISDLSTDNSQPAFNPRYRGILAYRTAIRVLNYLGVDSPVAAVYSSIAEGLYEAMVSEFILDHSTEPLQLGGRGLETRKYLPWFRTP
jgi:hypothetical protein